MGSTLAPWSLLLPNNANRALGRFKFSCRLDPVSNCWLWAGRLDKDGYGYSGNLRAHRASWEISRGPIPPGVLVCHHCDNPPCVNPDHLFLGSNADNMRDAARKGRRRGDRCPKSKLTEASVRTIVPRVAAGETQAAIAKSLGVKQQTINHILRGRSWGHLGLWRAERRYVFKLSADDKAAIRARVASGETLAAVARAFNVSWTSIRRTAPRVAP